MQAATDDQDYRCADTKHRCNEELDVTGAHCRASPAATYFLRFGQCGGVARRAESMFLSLFSVRIENSSAPGFRHFCMTAIGQFPLKMGVDPQNWWD
jgi:hypothetical protein